MWSHLYWYFNIRSDKSLSESLFSADIVAVLQKQKALKQTGPQSFVNKEDSSWMEISCVESKNGNYTRNDTDSTEKSNLIVVVASRRHNSAYDRYTDILIKVSNDLNWELILEEYDHDNEDIIINK